MSRQQLLTRLKTKGYKLTQQRQQILEILLTTTSRLSALEVHRLLQKRQVKISLDTVYRNLRLLVEIGALQQISLQSGQFMNWCSRINSIPMLFVDCEKVVYPCRPRPAEFYMELAGAAGFTILSHNMEIYGRCSGCSNNNSDC